MANSNLFLSEHSSDKYSLLCFFCVYALLNGCNINSGNKNSAVEFKKDTIIEFNIRKETEPQSKYLFYYVNYNSEFLVNLNKDYNIIEFYNFKSRKLDFEISLNKNPETSPMLWGFYVQTLDSIFTIRYRENIIALIDRQGNIINKWQPIDSIYNAREYELTAFASCPFYYRNKKIFINTRSLSYKNYYNTHSELIIDLDHTLPLLNNKTGAFPEIYKQGKDYYAFASYCSLNKNNQLVFSFEIDPNLYVYNYDTLIGTYPAKSIYLDDRFKEFDTTQVMDLNFVSKYLTTSGKYGQIIYDNYRNLYYRIVYHKQAYENADGTNNKYHDRQWSIIIMDEKFNILDEIKMEPKKYYFNNILVTKDGLLISNNNELNPDFNPSKFSFTLFKITLK